ncbi:hypothetical protein HPB50_000446 [Hyalomma asiaticum]|uniref:Uncharacterized protein n=1 Tax=Hyalomma asiaticum TaxID=266040 RepID=A0ACB7T8N7_HYAAI|nr:hypothetical protein HPB50_000446 [Hyalomma asiaticum]
MSASVTAGHGACLGSLATRSGTTVVIFAELREEVLGRFHQRHLGIAERKSRARSLMCRPRAVVDIRRDSFVQHVYNLTRETAITSGAALFACWTIGDNCVSSAVGNSDPAPTTVCAQQFTLRAASRG